MSAPALLSSCCWNNFFSYSFHKDFVAWKRTIVTIINTWLKELTYTSVWLKGFKIHTKNTLETVYRRSSIRENIWTFWLQNLRNKLINRKLLPFQHSGNFFASTYRVKQITKCINSVKITFKYDLIISTKSIQPRKSKR